VDENHSNIASVWGGLREGDQAWPDDSQWAKLREADRLELFEPAVDMVADDRGRVSVTFVLPMPSMSFLRLQPQV